ncbi:AAA family ATPase [Streptomyces sp. WAC 04229]|uniref:AAA family ATPase n=1 Tax=Streptomyces sp. WAC 04229 TaxID=2203206 RepID=UPI000F7360A6|nr:AAA family ATPase [Streptomyces sp. WAC 04229]RSN52706.1 AAA family ATPase [Streptomyces sp. WAC 04229]
MNDWRIYRGVGQPHDGVRRLPEPPPWRDFTRGRDGAQAGSEDPGGARRLGVRRRRAENYAPRPAEVDAVNAALYLRRPLLVTGNPGTGKSTLAYAVAHELKLGRVLRWPIVSRTTLQDGLYRYDAIGRLQDVQLERARGAGGNGNGSDDGNGGGNGSDGDDGADRDRGIGAYIRLGPLGTALLPSELPRVLLIDELDKSDLDLPNDLLNTLEEGEFAIPELERVADRQPVVEVLAHDSGRIAVHGGRIACTSFPLIVLTSNGERDFPAPLLRRCVQLELEPPGEEQLTAMVEAHLGEEGVAAGQDLIGRFLDREPGEVMAADQLLNALFLTQHTPHAERLTRERIADLLMQRLDRSR